MKKEKTIRNFSSIWKKINKSKSTVRKLILDNGVETNNIRIIQNELRTFYHGLYKSINDQRDITYEVNSFIHSAKLPKLTEDEKQSCEGNITFEEFRAVLSTFQRNKTPGNDGVPIDIIPIQSHLNM